MDTKFKTESILGILILFSMIVVTSALPTNHLTVNDTLPLVIYGNNTYPNQMVVIDGLANITGGTQVTGDMNATGQVCGSNGCYTPYTAGSGLILTINQFSIQPAYFDTRYVNKTTAFTGHVTGTYANTVVEDVACTGSCISDAEVDDGITVINYLPLAGGLMTGDIRYSGAGISDTTSNGLLTNLIVVNSSGDNPNNMYFVVEGTGKSGQIMPHFWIQGGNSTSASGVSRSFMIVDESAVNQNTTSITSCADYASYVGKELFIDCNTTTNGADLLVGDDMQVFGDAWFNDVHIEGMFEAGATYDSLNDLVTVVASAGVIDGGNVTTTDNNVTIGGGSGMARVNNTHTSPILFFDWTGETNFQVPLDQIIYFGLSYINGTITIENRTSYDWNFRTDFPLGSVINQAGSIHPLSSQWKVADGFANIIQRQDGEGIIRDEKLGGVIIGVTGVRNPTLSSGRIWKNVNKYTINTKDHNVSGTFDAWYRDGSGGWTKVENLTNYPVTHYDDGSGTLQLIANNQYCNWWVMLDIYEAENGRLQFIYPQTEHANTANAESEEVPNFPPAWYEHGLLVGRVIFQQGVDAPIEVQSSSSTVFTPSQASDHGNLAGLGDDDHGQYLLADGTRVFTGNLIPDADNTRTLGNSTNRLADVSSVLINGLDLCLENGICLTECESPQGTIDGCFVTGLPTSTQLQCMAASNFANYQEYVKAHMITEYVFNEQQNRWEEHRVYDESGSEEQFNNCIDTVITANGNKDYTFGRTNHMRLTELKDVLTRLDAVETFLCNQGGLQFC